MPAAQAGAHVPPLEGEPPSAVSAPEPPATSSTAVLDLLRYAEEYAGLPPEMQRQRIGEAELRNNLEPSPLALVRYGLLMALAKPERQAGAGAVADLREFIGQREFSETDRDLVPLAQVLAHVLDEREHLMAQNAELQRKLNQLKAIEQKLGGRDEAEIPVPTP